MTDMEKIAQRLGLWRELHEMFNVPRTIAERFSGTYADQMQKLREIDDDVRVEAEVLRGEFKSARDSLKERRYLDVAHFINNINKTLKKITNKISELKSSQDEHIHEFYGEHEYADPEEDYFAKSAGILDFFRSDRERAARVFERMYKKKLSAANGALKILVNQAKFLVDWALNTFKELGKARASGDIEKYIELSEAIEARRVIFEDKFKKTYEANIAPIASYLRQQKQKQTDEAREIGDQKQEELRKDLDKGPYREPAQVIQEAPPAQQEQAPPLSQPAVEPVVEVETGPASEPSKPEEAQTEPQPQEYQISPRLMQKPQSFDYIEIQRDEAGKPVAKKVQQYASAKKADLFLKLSKWLDDVGDEEGSVKALSIAEGFFE